MQYPAKIVYLCGADAVPLFHAVDGRTADTVFIDKRIGGFPTPFQRFPKRCITNHILIIFCSHFIDNSHIYDYNKVIMDYQTFLYKELVDCTISSLDFVYDLEKYALRNLSKSNQTTLDSKTVKHFASLLKKQKSCIDVLRSYLGEPDYLLRCQYYALLNDFYVHGLQQTGKFRKVYVVDFETIRTYADKLTALALQF